MDRRQQKTRKAVFDAFIKLLERKSYGNITVQEIIDRADIGRSTFYSHFETKDDLLKALCKEIFDHVFSEELMKEKTHDFSSPDAGMREKVIHILYHLRDSRSYLRGILSCESGEVFMRYFKEHLAGVFGEALTGTNPGIPEDYLLNHAVCSFAETVRWWMHNEAWSPEETGEFYLAVMPFVK